MFSFFDSFLDCSQMRHMLKWCICNHNILFVSQKTTRDWKNKVTSAVAAVVFLVVSIIVHHQWKICSGIRNHSSMDQPANAAGKSFFRHGTGQERFAKDPCRNCGATARSICIPKDLHWQYLPYGLWHAIRTEHIFSSLAMHGLGSVFQLWSVYFFFEDQQLWLPPGVSQI